MNFSKFLFRSLSTRDGFPTILNEDLAGFTPCTCIFALVFVPFDSFVVGRKVPFFVPLQEAINKGHVGSEFFEVFFPFLLLSGWIANPQGG